MDDIVKQAMAKWPNVPHCYGWLALDARGTWRMRNEQAQAANLPGEKIRNAALVAFINRNYTHDDQGRWYFQNGPQRVYVDLEATPYVASFNPAQGFLLHTGEAMPPVEKIWMTGLGQFILQSAGKTALLDDRDIVSCLEKLRIDDEPITDENLMAWLKESDKPGMNMMLHLPDAQLPVNRIPGGGLALHFGFISRPRAENA